MSNGTLAIRGASKYWLEKAKQEMGAERPYKGEYKQPTAPSTTRTGVSEAGDWLKRYRESEQRGKTRQTQRQQEYEAKRREYAKQLPTKTIEPIDTIINNAVPGYMKQIIPADYFKQFEAEQIPYIIETMHWGLFGDPASGGKWTGGKTETYWRALRGQISPDEIYFRGYMNQPLTQIPTTPQELMSALITKKITPAVAKMVIPLYAKAGILPDDLKVMETMLGGDVSFKEVPLNVFLNAKVDFEAGKTWTRDQLVYALIDLCDMTDIEAFEYVDEMSDEYGIDYFTRGATGISLEARD